MVHCRAAGDHLAGTGLQTLTDGRLHEYLPRGEPFCLVPGDGVTAIDFKTVFTDHADHEKLALVAAMRAPFRFGVPHVQRDGW